MALADPACDFVADVVQAPDATAVVDVAVPAAPQVRAAIADLAELQALGGTAAQVAIQA